MDEDITNLEQIVAQLSASTPCPDLSGNVSKDFRCFNEHEYPQIAIAFVLVAQLIFLGFNDL
jgi:hypothetical protein